MMFKLLLFLFFHPILSVKIIDNGLAPPEIVHSPVALKPRCVIKAPPLDLIFILDSSGSLRDKFQDEIDIIRRIVNHVTIGDTATRVMLVQFSGTQHLEFDFHKFTSREEILEALKVLRHVSGITRIGGAFEFTLEKMINSNTGVRDASVPKILYLLSDGRTHDFPKDWEQAELVRRKIPNIDIWAYGTGEYVAMTALLNYTQDVSKIVTNKNLHQLEPQFNRFHGTEICEKIPTCIKGSDKPLDMVLLVDASESLDHLFRDQIKFAIERVVANINVHPDAVRLALITYSGNFFNHFGFNDFHFGNNSAVVEHLKTLRSIKGTTSTHIALKEAMNQLLNEDVNSGTRNGVPKLVLVLTDGHSARSPLAQATLLREKGIIILAVSVTPRPLVDEAELLMIAGDPSRVFTPRNLQDFENEFMKYVGFGCEGITLDSNAKPQIRGATDVTCNANSVTFTVRTQRPMQGLMYAQHYHDDENCVLITRGDTREVSITLREGTCGVTKTPTINRDGSQFNVTIILQFHPLIMTRADQGLDVNCIHHEAPSHQEIDRSVIKRVSDTECSYTLHRYNPQQCVALDAKVGETLYHKWTCDTPDQYRYLIHDCYAKSESNTVRILDSNGCEIDQHFVETPNYSRFEKQGNDLVSYVFQEMSVFKFPGDENLIFRCRISLCDMEDKASGCAELIPPKCQKNANILNKDRIRREAGLPEETSQRPRIFHLDKQTMHRNRRHNVVDTKPGFALTVEVETRTLNILLGENVRPKNSLKYCDIS
ncbi:unnamed protein product [Auanema sp. JU1783]|nr:unnamed protein product [Auanema sp. JU1783]